MSDERTRASLILLLEISRELNTTLDQRMILTRVLSLCSKNVGAERASLIIVDDNLQPVDAAMIYDNQVRPPTFLHLGDVMTSGLAGWVAQQREIAWLPDTSTDVRWLRRPDDAFDQSGPKSAICAPLLAGSQLVGILTIVHPEQNYFNADHVELVRGIADLAALAVRNARLYASLQVAHRRYRELFEESLDPILITNWQGGIMDANRQAERFTGHPKVSLSERTIADLFEARKDKVGENFVELMGGDTVSFETFLVRRDGSQRPIEVHVRRIDYSGVESLQWIVRDISERYELDQTREDLVAMIYHDLRSPLANIVSSLDLLNTMISPEDRVNVEPVLNIANRSIERLQRLINSLLDINRLEAGQPITNRRLIEPSQTVRETVDVVRLAYESKQQKLSTSIEENIPQLQADADMIRRVLINLVENASKFSPVGSELEVGVRRDDHDVVFWVKDQGSGIPAESRELIFDKFTRLQEGRSAKGFGLGLAFCRLAVQAHGGRIWVEGDAKIGSTFMFTLPLNFENVTE